MTQQSFTHAPTAAALHAQPAQPAPAKRRKLAKRKPGSGFAAMLDATRAANADARQR